MIFFLSLSFLLSRVILQLKTFRISFRFCFNEAVNRFFLLSKSQITEETQMYPVLILENLVGTPKMYI